MYLKHGGREGERSKEREAGEGEREGGRGQERDYIVQFSLMNSR